MADLNTIQAVKDKQNTPEFLGDIGSNSVPNITPEIHRETNNDMMDTLLGEDEESGIVGRLIDSKLTNFRPTAQDSPFTITDFRANIATQQHSPYDLPTSITFTYIVHNPNSVNGDLTLSLGNTVLSNAVSPNSSSFTANVASQTLQDGDFVTFTLSGTNTSEAGGTPYSVSYRITARTAPTPEPSPTFEWRSTDTDNTPGDGVWNEVQNAEVSTPLIFDATVAIDNDGFDFRVPIAFEITRIENGFGTLFVDDTSNWVETTDATYRIYSRSNFNPGTSHWRITIGNN